MSCLRQSSSVLSQWIAFVTTSLLATGTSRYTLVTLPADCYLVQHRVLRTRARAVFCRCEDEFKREIASSNRLYKSFEEASEEADKEKEDCFLRLLCATMGEQEPKRCIVTDFFPPLDANGVEKVERCFLSNGQERRGCAPCVFASSGTAPEVVVLRCQCKLR